MTHQIHTKKHTSLLYQSKYPMLLLLCYMLIPSVYAQTEPQKERTTFNESVIVTSSFSPIVNEAFKLNENPSISDTGKLNKNLSFDISPRKYNVHLPLDPIKPAKIVGEPISKLYNTFIKAGLGTYWTGYLDAFYSGGRSRKLLYTVNLRHYGSAGQIKDYGHSAFSNTNLCFYGKKIWQNFEIDGDLSLSNDKNYYYGFPLLDPIDNISRKEIPSADYKTSWNQANFHLRYASRYLDNQALHHNFGVGFYSRTNNWGTNELNFNVKGKIYSQFPLFSDALQTIGLDIDMDYLRQSYSFEKNPYDYNNPYSPASFDEKNGVNILNFRPYIQFLYGKFEIEGALNITFASKSSSTLHLYPLAKVHIPIFPGIMGLYAGLEGHLERNSFQSLYLENPYLGPYSQMDYTDHRFKMYGGMQISPYKSIDFRAQVGFERINNMVFFLIDTLSALKNIYAPVYDDVTLWTIGGEVTYHVNDVFDLSSKVGFYSYTNTLLEAPLHKPSFDLSLNFSYLLAKKILISFSPYFAGGCKGWDGYQIVDLDPRISINLKMDYRYSKQLGIFMNLNNLAFQRHYVFTNYPSQKFMIMLGASYAF